MEEALPSRFQPTPLVLSQEDITFDPALIATPERRMPTVVPLQNRASVSPSGGRVMRVHFDKNVAVHHLSPECVDSSESQDEQFFTADCQTAEGVVCHELDLSNLSDNEPISVVASDLRKCSLSSTNGTKLRGSCAKRLSNVTNFINENLKGNTVNQKSLKKLRSHSLASEKSDCIIRELVTSSAAGDAANHKSQRHKKVSSVNNGRKKAVSPVVVSETGSTETHYSIENTSKLAASLQSTELKCVLAKPELNSTLRLGREIEEVKEQEFNFSNALKEKINPKIKNKLAEKAYSKLNAESDMFPCLIGIDVTETDLVTQQSNRTVTSDTTPREKAEEKISRIPDVMDFFTRDLHKETPSVSMVAMSSFRLEPHAAGLDHAFDLYRHIRTWEKL